MVTASAMADDPFVHLLTSAACTETKALQACAALISQQLAAAYCTLRFCFRDSKMTRATEYL